MTEGLPQLQASRWSAWRAQALAGDASARRYWRLREPDSDRSVIVMLAPPEICGSQAPFVKIARQLKDLGLSSPGILHSDLDTGLLVLEDLGKADFAGWLQARPSEEQMLYAAATDCLIRLHEAPPPADLTRMTPKVGAAMLDPFFDHCAPTLTGAARQAVRSGMTDALGAIAGLGEAFALRDFHAENLIWRPDREGVGKVGLLDFQDAFIAPAGYDLVSILRDARRDVSEDVIEFCKSRFVRATGLDAGLFEQGFATLSVQRNLRILGIFARLAREAGRTGYLDLMPRVRGHVLTDLTHPSLAALRKDILPCLEDLR